jgi:hypothetical protein
MLPVSLPRTGPGPEGQFLMRLDTPDDLRQWRWAFDCTERQLRHAVAAVGPRVADVRRYLLATRN